MDEAPNHDVDQPTVTQTQSSRPTDAASLILTINGGSSSLKFALFDHADCSRRPAEGHIERIGTGQAQWTTHGLHDDFKEDRSVEAPDQQAAAALVIKWLDLKFGLAAIVAIGYRIVHGGTQFYLPQPATTAVLDQLRKNCPLDPDHLPGELALIEAFQERCPTTTQVVCFDTAFHHELPRVAQIVPIPRKFAAAGVRRFGFHGLSYEFLMKELGRIAPAEESQGRVILAHLGSGASLAAVYGGRSVDTTMGFTPASGLVMGTRAGDIDPGIVRFLAQQEGVASEQFDQLVNHESGLLGVSETSSDVRDLLARQSDDVRAAEAIELFCYCTRKAIGAYAAVLGGVDSLVFSGGIGEKAAEIRRRICDGLGFLGIHINENCNQANASVISTSEGRVKVRVIHTDEEQTIVNGVIRVLQHASNRETKP